MLEAVAAVGNLQLVLVGDGSLRDALAKRATGLGVDIELIGVVPHKTLPSHLQKADLFVLPSHIEGHPKALLEAMSVGLPCVATDVPDTRDLLLDGETGIFCPGTDPSDLAIGLRRFLQDRATA
jgi:glycosyltransferase involved in cell wall biosynthesis